MATRIQLIASAETHAKIIARLWLLLLYLPLLFSCGPDKSRLSPREQSPNKGKDEKVVVEAFLFDAKLRRDGKPTSLRLEMYQADSVIGLNGRGYLGKTGLKGILTKDSLVVYFPTTDEFVAEGTADLLASLPCEIEARSLDLFAMFTSLPDSLPLDSQIRVESDYSKSKRPKFVLSIPGCLWEIRLMYDRKKQGWRIREFEYENGEKTSFRATRREYRRRAKVRNSRLGLTIPSSATRISP